MTDAARSTAKTDAPLIGGLVGRMRERNRERGSLTALVGNRNCLHDNLTYDELFRTVDEVAAGLVSLGCKPGAHVGLVAENSDLWLFASLGIMSLGAVDVPRGGDAPADEVVFCLDHADCKSAIVESARHVDYLEPIRDQLEFVVVLKGDAPDGTLSFEQLLERGRTQLAETPDVVETMRAAIDPEDLCTIIYTSGTTGNPKGVMLSHRNLYHNVRVIPHVLPFYVGGRFLSFLPSWHSFERTIEYIILDHGMEIHYGSKATLREDFVRVRPTFVAGVPRVYEVFSRSVTDAVRKRKGFGGSLIRKCMDGSRVLVDAVRRARGWKIRTDGQVLASGLIAWIGVAFLGLFLAVPHFLARKLVYSKLHAALGGEVKAMVSGGGPLPDHVDELMTRAGLPLLNGYGLTETSPVLTCRRLNHNPLLSIGTPIPETEIRIVDGEGSDVGRMNKGIIQARGPQVMRGYYKNDSATAAALVGDGWFDTGDTGRLSTRGDLLITGRAKETIVLTGGENVEPEPIEGKLITSPFIGDAVLVGHGKKSLGALIVPDFDSVREHMELGKSVSGADIAANGDANSLLKSEVNRIASTANGFRTFERIGKIAVLERPFTSEDGTLTQSLKKRRAIIEQRYAELIASLF